MNIVIHEPQIPQNTGNIARTCAVTGARLHLIEPLGFTVADAKLKRAGLDYWDKLDITFHKNIESFLGSINIEKVFLFSTKARQKYSDISYPADAYLLFGREDRGLPEDFIRAHYDRAVRLPMRNELRSLNLSNAAAIAAYEVLRQNGFPDME